MPGAIYAEGLVKTFGDVRALDGVDLDVPEGTVLGLLGPNGAGKTTAVRVLTTLLQPDSGRAVVAGIDVVKNPNEVRRSIGLSGQFAAVDEYLTGRENLRMVGELYQMRGRAARARAVELLERFHLSDAADRPAKTYSGGMRRRLDLAAALVVSPPVMFMDEPTTGLDPRNRQQLWGIIQDLVAGGTTLLLTTQYLEEADHLAHDICVVDQGKVIARGTADELKAQTGGERVEVVVQEPGQIGPARTVLAAFAEAGRGDDSRRSGEDLVAVVEHTRKLTVPVTGGARLLAEVIRELDTRGVEIDDIGLRRPTLDDVFITLTGHSVEEGEKDDGNGGNGGNGGGGENGGGGDEGRGKPPAARDRDGAGATPAKEAEK
ncbi:ATP-binding cassette domain-containing protein [Streptomyces sp. 150FB]|uniref:ATP-binding cassette domain-containing protein n=1 Tax=Streptomyces sp. 150FB TaxID=1576605 RepID=UPI00099C4E4A|nr:ATP-binding cassette domain-containing protein [Streptomyces sp. 150FB]